MTLNLQEFYTGGINRAYKDNEFVAYFTIDNTSVISVGQEMGLDATTKLAHPLAAGAAGGGAADVFIGFAEDIQPALGDMNRYVICRQRGQTLLNIAGCAATDLQKPVYGLGNNTYGYAPTNGLSGGSLVNYTRIGTVVGYTDGTGTNSAPGVWVRLEVPLGA